MARSFISSSVQTLAEQGIDSVLKLTGEMSFSCWFTPTAVSGFGEAVSTYGGGSPFGMVYALWWNTPIAVGKMAFANNQTVFGDVLGTTSLNAQQLYHVGATRVGTTGDWDLELFLDGVLDASAHTGLNPVSSVGQKARIGRWGSITSNYNLNADLVAECAWWNKSLTADEFKALHAGVSPLDIRSSARVGYMPIFGRSDPEPELVSGLAFDNVNTPAYVEHRVPILPRRQARRIFISSLVGGTISPSGIATSEVFGSPSLSAGPVAVSPSAIASIEAFGSPSISATLDLEPTGIATAETFGAHAVTVGALTLSPSGVASLEAFGTHEVAGGAAGISPEGIASLEIFGSTTLAPGEVTVSPGAIGSVEAFGGPVLQLFTTLSPEAITSLEAFGAGALSLGAVTVSPSGIASLEAFGTTIVTGGIDLFGSNLEFSAPASIHHYTVPVQIFHYLVAENDDDD